VRSNAHSYRNSKVRKNPSSDSKLSQPPHEQIPADAMVPQGRRSPAPSPRRHFQRQARFQLRPAVRSQPRTRSGYGCLTPNLAAVPAMTDPWRGRSDDRYDRSRHLGDPRCLQTLINLQSPNNALHHNTMYKITIWFGIYEYKLSILSETFWTWLNKTASIGYKIA
jgi:hypothetical protein